MSVNKIKENKEVHKYIKETNKDKEGKIKKKEEKEKKKKIYLKTEMEKIKKIECGIKFKNKHQVYSFNFKNSDIKLIYAIQQSFRKYMKYNNYKDESVLELHGTKEPSQAIINLDNKALFWIDSKTQKDSGSVCVKLQGCKEKIKNLEKQYKDEFKINYIFVLENYFKDKCPAELELLKKYKIPVFWSDDKDYKSKIIKFILDN